MILSNGSLTVKKEKTEGSGYVRKKEKIGKNEFFSIWLLLAGFGAITTLVLIMCISSAGKIPDNVGRVLTE